MRYEHIETELGHGLGIITLNSPPLNIMNMALLEEINAVLKEWLGLKTLKILVFNAKGKCFSAGVDVGEHVGNLAPKMIGVFHRMFRFLNKFEIPILSSIYGTCLGGGCELAIFSDLVVAAESTKIGQPEVQVGVFPPIATYIMPRIIGRKAAMDLILSGRIISAQEALQMGLVNRVVKDEALEKETKEFIKPYLKLSAEVLRQTKKAIVAGLMDELEPALKIIEGIYLNELMKTHDANEGLTAFVERRKPVWRNE